MGLLEEEQSPRSGLASEEHVFAVGKAVFIKLSRVSVFLQSSSVGSVITRHRIIGHHCITSRLIQLSDPIATMLRDSAWQVGKITIYDSSYDRHCAEDRANDLRALIPRKMAQKLSLMK